VTRPDTVAPAVAPPDDDEVFAAAPGGAAGRTALAGALPIVAALAGIVVVWYAVTYLVLAPAQRFLLPPPHQVFAVIGKPTVMGPMLDALGRSVAVALVGLVVAIVLGIGWAVAMSQSGLVEKVLYPYAVILQTIPILALIPLIGIWLGYGIPARVVVCVIIAVFPMISNTFFGLQSASPAARDLFRLNRATRSQVLLKLQFPAAVPSIFTGLRNAAGLSVIGVIVGDFYFQQGAPGIGGLLRVYTLRIQMDALLTAVTLTALFGVVVFTVFAVLDRAVVGRWYGSGGR
jgi:NitT/TauT family transport system permease protein